jgi:hypothetical protein
MPVRLADICRVPGSATAPVAPVGVSPTGLFSFNRIGMVFLTSHGLKTFTITGRTILDCAATEVSNDTLPLMVFAGTASRRAISS